MAQYWTDFEGTATGNPPADWTSRYNAWTTTEVVADVDASNGKALRLRTSSATNQRCLLSWDEIDADADRDDCEVVIRFKMSATPGGNVAVGAFGRGSGAAGSETGYGMALKQLDALLGRLYDAGSGTNLNEVAVTTTVDTYEFVRFRINATTVRGRKWAGTVGDEPVTWDIDVTDSVVTAAGWVGLFGFVHSIDYDFDWVGVGTNGDTAPTAAPFPEIAPTGIASAEAFGTATLSPGSVNLAPTGIVSAEAFGQATVSPGAVTLVPSGIPSAEAFGLPVLVGAGQIVPVGIASAEAFGTPALVPGPVVVSPAGIASGEAFGAIQVSPGSVVLLPVGIASAEAFGSPQLVVADRIFTPPTVLDIPPIYIRPDKQYPVGPLAQRLFRFYGPRARGRSVLKIGGAYFTLDNPTTDQIEVATEVYLGGRSYVVSKEVAAALEAAGYVVA